MLYRETNELSSDEKCYSEPTWLNIGVALILILGISFSYIPQYVTIIRKRSSDGLNYVMIAILVESSFLTAINSGMLSWPSIVCCVDVPLSLSECIKNNLATEQLLISLVCSLILYIIFLIYFSIGPTELEIRVERWRTKRTSTLLLLAIVMSSILLAVLSGVLFYNLGIDSHEMTVYAQILGISSSLLMIVQWAPQIYTTWRRKVRFKSSITL